MKIGGNYSEPALVPVERAWRVEKVAAANSLRDESRRYPARTLLVSKPAAESNSTRCGTCVIDGEQQLLQPAFVAQVLGQMMGTTPDNLTAARAYAQTCRLNTNLQFADMA